MGDAVEGGEGVGDAGGCAGGVGDGGVGDGEVGGERDVDGGWGTGSVLGERLSDCATQRRGRVRAVSRLLHELEPRVESSDRRALQPE